MKHYSLLLITIAFFSCCNRHDQRKNEITKIEVATGGCFGPCQSTVVSIDSSLVYKYFGGETHFTLPFESTDNKKLKGYYSAIISRGYWDTVNMEIRKYKF